MQQDLRTARRRTVSCCPLTYPSIRKRQDAPPHPAFLPTSTKDCAQLYPPISSVNPLLMLPQRIDCTFPDISFAMPYSQPPFLIFSDGCNLCQPKAPLHRPDKGCIHPKVSETLRIPGNPTQDRMHSSCHTLHICPSEPF